MIALVARLCLRLLRHYGAKNVYIRWAVWILVVVRWFLRRRHGTTQSVQLKKGETLVVSISKNEA